MTPSPVKLQEVTISGVTYQLKFGTLAELTCSEMGVSIGSFIREMATPHAFSDYLKLFSGMVAHHFLRNAQPIPNPQQWAMTIEAQGDRETQLKICGTIIDAVRNTIFVPNLSAATVTLREPAPSPENPSSPVN